MAVYLNAGQLSNCKVCNVFLGKKSRRLRGAPTPLSRGQATPASVATLRPIIRNENGHPSNWGISFTVYTVLCYRGGREPWAPAASPAKSGVRLRHSRPAAMVSVIVAAAEWEATGVKFSAHSWALRDRSLFGLMGTTSIAILVSFVDMN